MMDKREENLKKLSARKLTEGSGLVVISDVVEFTKELQRKIDSLKEVVGVGIEVEADDLIDELKKVNSLIPSIKSLAEAIDSIDIPAIPEIPKTIELNGLNEAVGTIKAQNELLEKVNIPDTFSIKGLSDLEKALKTYTDVIKNQKNPEKIKFELDNVSIVTDKLDDLIKAVDDNTADQSQNVEDYTPVRRVRLIGNRLFFDDDAWSGGGGGGGGGGDASAANQTDGSQKTQIVDAGGEAATVTSGRLDTNTAAQPGVDIGDVTVNNAAGASAVNIQDGGNSITVDGTVTANIGTTNGLALDATLTGGNQQVQGNVASGSADSGNPVKVGGRNNTTLPTLTDGQRGDLQLDTRGNLRAVLSNGSNLHGYGADNVDTVSTSTTVNKMQIISRGTVFNGTTWDRMPGDTTGVKVQTHAVTSASATGAAVPANAFYVGINNASGNLTGVQSVGAAADSAGATILSAGAMAQLDDVSPATVSEGNYRAIRMSSDRSLLTAQRSTTPDQTSVPGSVTSVTLLAANNARKGATITNDSSAVLYLKMGATASTTSYSVTISGNAAAPFSYYEVPYGYVGVIDGIWASATGNARITELT